MLEADSLRCHFDAEINYQRSHPTPIFVSSIVARRNHVEIRSCRGGIGGKEVNAVYLHVYGRVLYPDLRAHHSIADRKPVPAVSDRFVVVDVMVGNVTSALGTIDYVH